MSIKAATVNAASGSYQSVVVTCDVCMREIANQKQAGVVYDGQKDKAALELDGLVFVCDADRNAPCCIEAHSRFAGNAGQCKLEPFLKQLTQNGMSNLPAAVDAATTGRGNAQ